MNQTKTLPMLTVGDYLDGNASYKGWIESVAVLALKGIGEPRKPGAPLPPLWWLQPRRNE